MNAEAQLRLIEPFKPEDLEWRIQQSADDHTWALVLCYVTARACQDRLDEVFSPMGWQDFYKHVKTGEHNDGKGNIRDLGGVMCRLKVWDTDMGEWIEKSNGSPETAIESFKGGISKAFVRVCASGLGIGRYLYGLTATFVTLHTAKDKHEQMTYIKGKKYYWDPPKLPPEALPPGYKYPNSKPQQDPPPTPPPVDKPKDKFYLLDRFKKAKETAGEDIYYKILGEMGYKKSSEIKPEHRDEALKLFRKEYRKYAVNQ